MAEPFRQAKLCSKGGRRYCKITHFCECLRLLPIDVSSMDKVFWAGIYVLVVNSLRQLGSLVPVVTLLTSDLPLSVFSSQCLFLLEILLLFLSRWKKMYKMALSKWICCYIFLLYFCSQCCRTKISIFR